jgi:hypothetical protein
MSKNIKAKRNLKILEINFIKTKQNKTKNKDRNGEKHNNFLSVLSWWIWD